MKKGRDHLLTKGNLDASFNIYQLHPKIWCLQGFSDQNAANHS